MVYFGVYVDDNMINSLIIDLVDGLIDDFFTIAGFAGIASATSPCWRSTDSTSGVISGDR